MVKLMRDGHQIVLMMAQIDLAQFYSLVLKINNSNYAQQSSSARI